MIIVGDSLYLLEKWAQIFMTSQGGGSRWGVDRAGLIVGQGLLGLGEGSMIPSTLLYRSEILHNYIFKNFFIMLLSILKNQILKNVR